MNKSIVNQYYSDEKDHRNWMVPFPEGLTHGYPQGRFLKFFHFANNNLLTFRFSRSLLFQSICIIFWNGSHAISLLWPFALLWYFWWMFSVKFASCSIHYFNFFIESFGWFTYFVSQFIQIPTVLLVAIWYIKRIRKKGNFWQVK